MARTVWDNICYGAVRCADIEAENARGERNEKVGKRAVIARKAQVAYLAAKARSRRLETYLRKRAIRSLTRL